MWLQGLTVTFFFTCPFGQVQEKITCPHLLSTCPKIKCYLLQTLMEISQTHSYLGHWHIFGWLLIHTWIIGFLLKKKKRFTGQTQESQILFFVQVVVVLSFVLLHYPLLSPSLKAGFHLLKLNSQSGHSNLTHCSHSCSLSLALCSAFAEFDDWDSVDRFPKNENRDRWAMTWINFPGTHFDRAHDAKSASIGLPLDNSSQWKGALCCCLQLQWNWVSGELASPCQYVMSSAN